MVLGRRVVRSHVYFRKITFLVLERGWQCSLGDKLGGWGDLHWRGGGLHWSSGSMKSE